MATPKPALKQQLFNMVTNQHLVPWSSLFLPPGEGVTGHDSRWTKVSLIT